MDQELKADCTVWVEFLSDDILVCRPFVNFKEVLVADKIFFYTDVSGVANLGFGAILTGIGQTANGKENSLNCSVPL